MSGVREAERQNIANRPRLAGVECLRLLASLDIVLFHWDSQAFRPLAGIGLPYLSALAFFLILKKRRGNESQRQFAAVRFRRLILPWAFWSLLYLLFRLVKSYTGDEQIGGGVYWYVATLIGGGSTHLWFLPFLFVFSFFVFWYKYLERDWVRAVALFAVLGVILFIPGREFAWPFRQYLFVMPAVPLAIFAFWSIGWIERQKWGEAPLIGVLLATSGLLFGLSWYMQVEAPTSDGIVLVRWCLAYVLLLLGFRLKFGGVSWVFGLSVGAYGVYLVHPFVVSGFSVLRPYLPDYSPIGGTLCFIFSLALVMALSKTFLRRYL